MKKVFVFADTEWSVGRVHRDIARHLANEFEFRFLNWRNYDRNTFIQNYDWCQICLANISALDHVRESFHEVNFRKLLLLSHGAGDNRVVSFIDPDFVYGMTSDCLKRLFPPDAKVFLMPNGVDADSFSYKERSGELKTIGWCGAPHIQTKRIGWAHEIADRCHLSLRIGYGKSYDEIRDWYHEIDILIVTAGPDAHVETGPLPPFEAIISGIPAIGTRVGNFRNIPGPKFDTIDEAVSILHELQENPERMKQLAQEQYEYVIQNCTYEKVSHMWKEAFEYVALQFS